MSTVDFVFCLHNHQPVDNHEHVFQRAYADAYLPMIEALERRPKIRFCAHYSGPLLEWLQKNRLDFFIRLRNLVEAGRLELIGGGFFEPIFSMLPEQDVLGQIEMMQDYLHANFGARPDGAWVPERVWEPHLAETLAKAGVKYVVLDDFHFKTAGLRDEDLRGRFLTEHNGSLLSVFPGSERLRYTIPYQEPQATISHVLERTGSTVVYADDGEKFGLWPGTKKHCWEDGWIERFLDALEREERVRTTTFRDALERAPEGRVYLSTCSYREMGEWSLLTQGSEEYHRAVEELQRQGRFDSWKHFFVGGLWRNFRVKYPEANLMYGRMLHVSRRVAEAGAKAGAAREELYRAQCNCAYWHGVFGGLYLPHLRCSVYHHLIEAERHLEKAGFGSRVLDLDLDGRDEVRLFNPNLNLFVRPHGGGHVLELDARPALTNFAATLSRRPEHYHRRIREAAASAVGGEVQSIHDLVRSKVADIDQHLRYDPYPREGFIDHFFAPGAGPDGVETGGGEWGDFAWGEYEVEAWRNDKGVRAQLRRAGAVAGRRVEVTKEYFLPPEDAEFQVTYTVANRGAEPVRFRFAVEIPVAMCSATLPGAYLHRGDHADPLALGRPHQIAGPAIHVHDEWNRADIAILAASGEGFWTLPIHTVSQSESGFELLYQGTVITPYWDVAIEPGKTWGTVITQKVKIRP